MAEALVTGGSGTLGRAIISQLEQAGYRTLATYCHSPCPPKSQRTSYVQVDLEDHAAGKNFIASLAAHRFSLLIHTAGSTTDGLIVTQKALDWDRVWQIHYRFAASLGRALPQITNPSGAHLLLIGSISGACGRRGQVNYATAKGALAGLTVDLARRYAANNIQTNCILPGLMRSPLTAKLAPSQLGRLQSENLLGVINEPEQVAKTILNLAQYRPLSGQVINLDSRPLANPELLLW